MKLTDTGIDRLMRVTSTVTISVRGKSQKIYLRTLGAINAQARTDYATSRTRKLLVALRDPQSEAYRTYLDAIEGTPREDMLQRAYMMGLARIYRDTKDEVRPDDVLEPSDNPTITEVMDYENRREQAETDALDERSRLAQEKYAAYKAELEAMDDIALVEQLRDLMIDSLLNSEWGKASNDATLYYCSFRDAGHKTHYFESVGEVAEADPELYNELVSAYVELDSFASAPDELKNSPSVQE